MINILKVLFNPSIWMQNYQYSKHCEEWCIEALKYPNIKIINEYNALFNGKEIWIDNQPFAFHFEDVGVRPSRATCLKIYKLLNSKQQAKTNTKIKNYFQIESLNEIKQK